LDFVPAFIDELAWYYRQGSGVPPSVSLSNFNLELPDSATLENRSLVMWAAIDTLFSLLPPSDILTVVSSLLLDGQVLVLGNSLQEITMTVFALISLIQPFEFAGTIIPILPIGQSYLQLLNSPAPFLIGCVLTPALKEFAFVDTALFVELDKHKVSFSETEFPKFPAFDQVAAGMKSILGQRRNTEGGHPFGFPQQLPRILGHKIALRTGVAEQLVAIIQGPLGQITSDLLPMFFVTDLSAVDEGVTVFNRELFIATVNPGDLGFFMLLFDSMTFQMYVEKRIHEFAQERGRMKAEVLEPKKAVAGGLQRGRPRTRSINRIPTFSRDGPDSD
jgi:hypothetical protein